MQVPVAEGRPPLPSGARSPDLAGARVTAVARCREGPLRRRARRTAACCRSRSGSTRRSPAGARTVTPKVTFGDAVRRRPGAAAARSCAWRSPPPSGGPLTVAQVGADGARAPDACRSGRLSIGPEPQGGGAADAHAAGRGRDHGARAGRARRGPLPRRPRAASSLRYDLRDPSSPVLAETVDATTQPRRHRRAGLPHRRPHARDRRRGRGRVELAGGAGCRPAGAA